MLALCTCMVAFLFFEESYIISYKRGLLFYYYLTGDFQMP